jgi:uncharacterized small protein (DUF1192 family)
LNERIAELQTEVGELRAQVNVLRAIDKGAAIDLPAWLEKRNAAA